MSLERDVAGIIDARASMKAKEEAVRDIQAAKDYARDVRIAADADKQEAELYLQNARREANKREQELNQKQAQMDAKAANQGRTLVAERRRLDEWEQALTAREREVEQAERGIKTKALEAEQLQADAERLKAANDQRAQTITETIDRMTALWQHSM